MARYQIVSRKLSVYGDEAHAVVGIVCQEGKIETRNHGWAIADCPVVALCQAALNAIARFEGQPAVSLRVEKAEDEKRVAFAIFRGKEHQLCSHEGDEAPSEAVVEAVSRLVAIINEPWEEVEHAAAK